MPLIARSDGLQFVLQPYRELIHFAKKSILIPKVQSLSQQHGQFVRLFKKAADQFEGVFSKEPGYLLGETVYQHFGRLQNLIFCEALADDHVLLVIVRDHSVYLDAKISLEQLQQELASAAVSAEPYHVFIYGKNLPFSEHPESGKFNLPSASVLSFAVLEEALFPRLVAHDDFRLQPIALALKAAQLTRQSPVAWGLGLVLVVVIFAAIMVHHSRVKSLIPVVKPVELPKVYPYQEYYKALSTPAPSQIVQELALLTHQLNFVPAWNVSLISYNGAQYQIQMNSQGGSLVSLDRWAAQHHFTVQLNAQGARLYMNSYLKNRASPTVVYSNPDMVKAVLDRLRHILPKQSVNLGNTQPRGSAQETQITIQLNQASGQLLLLLGEELEGLPISLSTLSFAMHNGLLSGSIQLSVWGNAQ